MNAAKILIIEDHNPDLELLRRFLDQQDANHELVVLKDGVTALRFIAEQRASKDPVAPCVIVLDLHLPMHSGLEVLRAIREAPPLSHVALIVLTALASPTEEAEIRKAGAWYRTKPSTLVEYQELVTLILDLCKSVPVATYS